MKYDELMYVLSHDDCDFCESKDANYGFDPDWDAMLCWPCHLMQNTMMLLVKYRVNKSLEFLGIK